MKLQAAQKVGQALLHQPGFTKEEDQLAIREVFNSEELQQTFSLVERLNKIANTAKALQSELEDRPVREEAPSAGC
jgi:hypothetical protein